MSTVALLERFAAEVEFTPVPGSSNLHIIQSKVPAADDQRACLTEVDWDKFEADINEAFEQVP